MRIDVIVNTTARRNAREPHLVDRLHRVARESGRTVTVHDTATLDALASTAGALATRGTDLVVLSGGDGTFMAGVTALARAFGEDRLPRLALLAGGTVATVARNWESAGDPVALLGNLLRDPGRVRFVPRPTLRVRGEVGGAEEERVGFIFGTGLVASFFQEYYARGARGYAGAARIVGRIFTESFWGGPLARRVLDPLPCSIEVEGRRLEPTAWSLVCAAVVRDLGIHMLVTYRAGEDPERPHLVASALPSGQLGPRAPLVLAGRRIGGKGHFDDLVRAFTVRFPDGAGPYVLDGDILHAREVRVTAGPVIRVAVRPD